jgi:gas vesicle protein
MSNENNNTETTADVAPAAAPISTLDDKTRTVRPGLFVKITSSMKGNVSYQRFDIITGEKLEDGSEKSEWNTRKHVENPDELERATKVRSMARSLVERICTNTTVGLWCAPDQKEALNAMRDKAEAIIAEFNRTATHTKLWFSVIPSRLESDDTRALRDITREVSRLVSQMDEGIKEVNTDKIREAATEARRLSSMLTDDKKAKVNAAVEQARKAANMITKRVEKAGEDAKMVLLDIQRSQIESARVAFLDMEETLAAEVLPVVNAQRFADLDMASAADCEPEAESKAPARNLDLSDESELKMSASPSINVPAMEL